MRKIFFWETLSITVLSTEASYIYHIILLLTKCVLQASLLLIVKIFFLFLKMLVPYTDFSNVHLGYASELQVFN